MTGVEDTAKRIEIRDLKLVLISAVASIISAYFLFAGGAKQADADMVSTLYNQVQALQATVFQQNSKIVSLEIQLSKKYESSVVLKNYLDAMPYPAWIKVVDVDEYGETKFVMWYTNDAYEDLFGVSSARYVGKTDFEIWDRNTALSFYKNDMVVLTKMSDYCTPEIFPKEPGSSKIIGGLTCKWAAMVAGKVAIAGQILLDKETKTQPEVMQK